MWNLFCCRRCRDVIWTLTRGYFKRSDQFTVLKSHWFGEKRGQITKPFTLCKIADGFKEAVKRQYTKKSDLNKDHERTHFWRPTRCLSSHVSLDRPRNPCPNVYLHSQFHVSVEKMISDEPRKFHVFSLLLLWNC